MTEKSIFIKNYKNLGISEQGTKLVLSSTTDPKLMGDLVILIGPNNAGKSNVLGAVVDSALVDGTLSDDTLTDFIYVNREDPIIRLEYKSKDEKFRKTLKHKAKVEYFKSIDYTNDEKEELMQIFFNFKEQLAEILKERGGDYFEENLTNIYKALLEINNFDDYISKFTMLNNVYRKNRVADRRYYKDVTIVDYYSSCYSVESSYYKNLISFENNIVSINEISFNKLFKDRYGFNFNHKVSKYVEQKIGNNMLSTAYDAWSNSTLLNSIFNKLDIDAEAISNVYNASRQTNNSGPLRKFEREVNSKLTSTIEDFNRMYPSDEKAKYRFEITFETNRINFNMYVGEAPINLERQSTGFRWFFDLYFNFLYNNNMNPGDVLIMDEPATNLHIKGQEELRDFLKRFAIKHQITILIATHSPFLTDVDFLDELRVVVRNGESSTIENNFSYVNGPDCHDTIDPIISAFTTRQSVIIDPSKTLIFVEGITDYNYLVALKHRLKVKDIIFIPINGLGDMKHIKSTINALLKVHKNPCVLVDGDKAGDDFVSSCKGTAITTYQLKDIDPKFTEIENVFSEKDAATYNICEQNKHFSTSSIFKKNVIFNNASLTKETVNNFKKVIDYLLDI